MSVEDCANYEEVKQQIAEKLTALRDTPNRWGAGGGNPAAWCMGFRVAVVAAGG
jgi:hypothetical protein